MDLLEPDGIDELESHWLGQCITPLLDSEEDGKKNNALPDMPS